jgi:subtilisin family serine protease
MLKLIDLSLNVQNRNSQTRINQEVPVADPFRTHAGFTPNRLAGQTRMPNFMYWTLVIIFYICLPFTPGQGLAKPSLSQEPASQYFPDRIIVKFATGTVAGPQHAPLKALMMPDRVTGILERFGAVETEQLFPPRPRQLQNKPARSDLSTIYEIDFAQSVNLPKLLSLLRQQPQVVYAEPVYFRQISYAPNDTDIIRQQYLNTIKAREAWDVTRGDTTVVIGIVDTGVEWQHPDLAANIWRNHDEIPNNGIDDDQNGYVDDVRGWDFGGLNGTADNDPREDFPAHGTHVAGIASAVTDNGIGVAGVGFKTKIMPVKTSRNDVRAPNGSPFILYGYQGIVYAAENGANIINCSWGGPGASQLEQEVIDYATELGALVVAAAGNSSSDRLFFPAGYRNVLAVANTSIDDRRNSNSNYGFWVDVSAPGTGIYNTWQPGTYISISGTSMSSPLAAGIAALVKSIHPDWPPAAIAEQVRLSGDNIDNLNPGFSRQLGYGRVNAQRAVTLQTPGVRVASYSLREAAGNQNGIFEANEEIAVSVSLVNLLEPVSNLSVSLSETSPHVSVVSGARNIGAIGRGDTVAVAETFNFRIGANVPASHVVTFFLNFSALGYEDWQGFTVIIRPLHGDLAVGNVATTITSFGAIGFDDYANNAGGGQIGRGFEFPIGNTSALFHGGLVLATAPNRVSDVSYGDAAGERYDFVTLSGGELKIQPGQRSTIEAIARFNDSVAEAPIGLTIDQKAYAWANEPWDDFIILEYRITNTTSQAVNNLYAGVYLDWDIDQSDNNFAAWDAGNQLGYEWANGSSYYGITTVFPATAKSYRAVKNQDYVGNNFTDARKYQFMTEGFQVVSSDEAHDWSQLLSHGPYSLAPGQNITVAFALLGGTDLADLQANARAARAAFLTTGVNAPSELLPQQFALSQNTPNPYARRKAEVTEIRYSVPEPGEVTLRIFNLLGQEVVVLARGFQQSGNHLVQWDGRDRRGLLVPAGVYFYQLRARDFTATRKMIVLE